MIKLMKKLAAFSTGIVYLFTTVNVFAQNITIIPPDQGYNDIGDFITKALQLAFIVAVIVVLAMLVWGAIEWIFSGGQKEAVASARSRIVNALVGFAILAVAFAIATLAGNFLGFPNITSFTVPTPNP